MRAKADSSDNLLLFEVILDEPIVKDIIAFLRVLRDLPFLNQVATCDIAVPAFIAVICLADIWEF